MNWFILRPLAFFDNLTPNFFGKVFATCFKTALKGKPLQMVATSDIGDFAAEGFLHPETYMGQGLSLAGDELRLINLRRSLRKRRAGSQFLLPSGQLAR